MYFKAILDWGWYLTPTYARSDLGVNIHLLVYELS